MMPEVDRTSHFCATRSGSHVPYWTLACPRKTPTEEGKVGICVLAQSIKSSQPANVPSYRPNAYASGFITLAHTKKKTKSQNRGLRAWDGRFGNIGRHWANIAGGFSADSEATGVAAYSSGRRLRGGCPCILLFGVHPRAWPVGFLLAPCHHRRQKRSVWTPTPCEIALLHSAR